VSRLLRSCDRRTVMGRRDYAILVLLSRLGLRAGEVAALTLDDIDWRHGEIVIRGKGGRRERLPLIRRTFGPMPPAGPGTIMRGIAVTSMGRPRKRVKGMTTDSRFTLNQARAAGERIGIDWDASPFDLEQFRKGMDIELEHGTRDPETNVTDDDVTMTAKIARAHLNEFPDYYTRLAKMEAEAEADRAAPGD